MRKMILIFVIVILSVLTVTSFLYATKYKKQTQILNDEIDKLNTHISLINSQNSKLSEEKDFAQKQYQDLKSTKNNSELIDIEIQECMKSCNYTTACMNNCVYNSAPKWEKEINKNLNALKNIMTPEQIELLNNSQAKWILYKDAQQKLNSQTIGTMDGTMYTNILAGEQVHLIELRAKELANLYSVYSEK